MDYYQGLKTFLYDVYLLLLLFWKIFQNIDFERVNEYQNDYEALKQQSWIGFAQVYLDRCGKKSQSDDNIDVQVYEKLVELDTRLGTTASEQLFACLTYTTRWDIIKVRYIILFRFHVLDCGQQSVAFKDI